MCMYVHHVCAWHLLVSEQGFKSLKQELQDACKIQQELLTAEPTLQPLISSLSQEKA